MNVLFAALIVRALALYGSEDIWGRKSKFDTSWHR